MNTTNESLKNLAKISVGQYNCPTVSTFVNVSFIFFFVTDAIIP